MAEDFNEDAVDERLLVRIKRAVLAGRYAFSEKASIEMEADGLTEFDMVEPILNAVAIYKKIRSRNPLCPKAREYLYVIQCTNFGLSAQKGNSPARGGGNLLLSHLLCGRCHDGNHYDQNPDLSAMQQQEIKRFGET